MVQNDILIAANNIHDRDICITKKQRNIIMHMLNKFYSLVHHLDHLISCLS